MLVRKFPSGFLADCGIVTWPLGALRFRFPFPAAAYLGDSLPRSGQAKEKLSQGMPSLPGMILGTSEDRIASPPDIHRMLRGGVAVGEIIFPPWPCRRVAR